MKNGNKTTEKIIFDVSELSHFDRAALGAGAYDGLVAHFNDPENQRRFAVWLEEYRRTGKLVPPPPREDQSPAPRHNERGKQVNDEKRKQDY